MKRYGFWVLGWLALAGCGPEQELWQPKHEDPPVPAEEVAKIEGVLPKTALAQPARPRKILVFSATAGFRHKSIPWGKAALEAMGKATGAYATVVSDDPGNFEKGRLAGFDAVVLLSPTQDFFMPGKKGGGKAATGGEAFTAEQMAALRERSDRLLANLEAYVRGGGGLVGIHAATDACYGRKSYGEMMGAYFESHPWTQNTRVTVRVEDREHALTRPVFEQQEYSFLEEIYQFREEIYSRDKLRILVVLDPAKSDAPNPKMPLKRTDNDYAVSWVQGYGSGRVFYTSLGHREDMYYNPVVLKHYLAGIQFACGDLAADTTPSNRVRR